MQSRRAAISCANWYQALALRLFFIRVRGEPGNEASVCVHVCVCVRGVYLCTCVCVYMCVCGVCVCTCVCVYMCVCVCVCVRVCVLQLFLPLQCTSSPLSPDPSTRTIHRLNPSLSSLPSLSSFSPLIPSFSFLRHLSVHSPSFIPSSLPSFHSPSLLSLPPPLTARWCPLYNASSGHTNFKRIKEENKRT